MRSLLTLTALFSISVCIGQDSDLNQIFYKYQVINIDVSAIVDRISNSRSQQKYVSIDKWALSLIASHLLGPKYKYLDQDNNSLSNKGSVPITLIGSTEDDGIASLTITKDFIMGFIEEGKETYYIEPLNHFDKKAKPEKFIIYNTRDIKENAPVKCGYTSSQQEYTKGTKSTTTKRENNNLCYEIEYFIANDYTMFQKYGLLGLEARNIAILNDVNTNFVTAFEDEVRIVLNGQYVSDCVSCDPWSSSMVFTTVLNSFRAS